VTWWQLVLVDTFVIGALSLAIGYLGHRLPATWFERDTWLTRPRSFEDDGRFYARALRINRWKDRAPEAGALFAGGFDKKRLRSRDIAELTTHLQETRRAEWVHWADAVTPFTLFFWFPAAIAAPTAATMVVCNAPFVAILRYNRIRLDRILRLRTREP
jgi:glycosyl-4,4'-diaponeurosporenoate acyltransferase